MIFAVQLSAQTPPQISPEVAAQLIMNPQLPVDNSQLGNVSVTAEFDAPAVAPGAKTFYRVTINATQNTIRWPDEISLPAELRLVHAARGQLAQADGTPFHPVTQFIYEVTPTITGRFVVKNFMVLVGSQTVEIPAATLDVSEANTNSALERKLTLEISETNLFFGQPFRVRVIAPPSLGNQLEALRDVQFDGRGFLTDKLATRQLIEAVPRAGKLAAAFVYETIATPLAIGAQSFSAQAFTVPPFSAGPLVITAASGPISLSGMSSAKPMFLVSDAIDLNARPLPEANRLAGFTGAIGKFLTDKPQLSTNRIHVGEPLHLKFGFHGEGNLTRFVAPEMPRSRDWQIIVDRLPNTGVTLIPQTDEVTNTPAIPFCAFDPAQKKYYDLTIPALPVEVVGNGLPVKVSVENNEQNVALEKLSELALTPGKMFGCLKPLQTRVISWFLALLPVLGFLALWRWDEARRFWEAHPDLARRRKSKRDLRKEKKKLQAAWMANDVEKFVSHAVMVLRIAAAPHFPANERALVCAEILAQLSVVQQNGRAGETVRKIFAIMDTQFGRIETTTKLSARDVLALKPEVESVLQILEAKL